MHISYNLEGETCDSCGAEEIVWWEEDETESTMEVYVDCRSCGKNFPKRFVNKSEDTSHDALETIAREIVN